MKCRNVEYTKNNSKTVIVEQIFENNRFFVCVCLTWIFYLKISQNFSLDTVLEIQKNCKVCKKMKKE